MGTAFAKNRRINKISVGKRMDKWRALINSIMNNTNQVNRNTHQIAINMVFSVIAFVINLLISFFITPYITNQFGSDAYGFVKLANDFTNYASLASIALNSMASRFLMLAREQGKCEEAQKYFSSIHLANMVMTGVLSIVAIFCVVFLEYFLVIPAILVYEVKITFAVTFLAFLSNLFFSTYSNCYYLTNKLSIGSIRDAITNIIRIITIVALFSLLTPRISYVAFGGLLATVFSVIYNFGFTRKLLPEFRFRICDFDWKKLCQVLFAGIWNSITKLSQIFSSGLDLMVTNLFLGSADMGYLAVAKTVPNIIVTFNTTIANVFSPNMMAFYAVGDTEQLKKISKTAMKFMCMFVTIPNAILMMMGKEFYELWVPTQPAQLLCVLSVLTVVNSCVTGPLAPLYQIFTITNKVKQNSIVMICYGFLSILLTFVCLQVTDLGLYAVAGVSLVGSVIVALCYHLPFSAIYIGLPWHTFFPEIGKGVFSLIVQCCICWCIHRILPFKLSWWTWFLSAGLAAILGLIVNFFLVLKKEERNWILEKVFAKMKKR